MVIHPVSPSQGRGIEDVRLLEFTDGDGGTSYRGTFTAFSGSEVRQGLIQTKDFKSFEMRGVEGDLWLPMQLSERDHPDRNGMRP